MFVISVQFRFSNKIIKAANKAFTMLANGKLKNLKYRDCGNDINNFASGISKFKPDHTEAHASRLN